MRNGNSIGSLVLIDCHAQKPFERTFCANLEAFAKFGIEICQKLVALVSQDDVVDVDAKNDFIAILAGEMVKTRVARRLLESVVVNEKLPKCFLP